MFLLLFEVFLYIDTNLRLFCCIIVVVLNVTGPHNLIGSGTIRRYGFVGVGVTLLEEMCHCRVGFEDSHAQDTPEFLSRLPVACKI